MVRIVTDSSSDISPELAHQLGIIVVPLYLRFGEDIYRDGVDMGTDEFYRKLETSSVRPTTSAPSPGDFVKVYEELAKDTDEIASIHIGSKVSATYEAALRAKEALGEAKCRVEVVDSQWTTMALGLIAIAAAKLAKAGMNLHDVVSEASNSIPRIHLLGVFDTLKYLLLGGRISKHKAIMGGVLNVKPLIAMRDGVLAQAGLVRTRAKGTERLYEAVRNALSIQDLAIVYSTTLEEATSLRERIGSIFAKERIQMARLGPALGVHGGPGTLILAFREEENRPGKKVIAGENKRRLSLSSLRLPGQCLWCCQPQVRNPAIFLRLGLLKA